MFQAAWDWERAHDRLKTSTFQPLLDIIEAIIKKRKVKAVETCNKHVSVVLCIHKRDHHKLEVPNKPKEVKPFQRPEK